MISPRRCFFFYRGCPAPLDPPRSAMLPGAALGATVNGLRQVRGSMDWPLAEPYISPDKTLGMGRPAKDA